MKKWVRRAFSIHARGYWRAACRMQLGRGTLTCEGSRESQNPDSAWKSRIWVGSGGWKEETKVTPGHQREWLGDGGTVLPDPECRRKPGVLPLFPFLLCPAGLISTDGSIGLPVLWLLVRLSHLEAQPHSEGGRKEPRGHLFPGQFYAWVQVLQPSLGARNSPLPLKPVFRVTAAWCRPCRDASPLLVVFFNRATSWKQLLY